MLFCLAHHACYSNRWNVLQYNDVADQFVVVWLGIVAFRVDVKHYLHTQARGVKVSLSHTMPHTN